MCHKENSKKIISFLDLQHCSKSKNKKICLGVLLPKAPIGGITMSPKPQAVFIKLNLKKNGGSTKCLEKPLIGR